jgi:hypothetical protein
MKILFTVNNRETGTAIAKGEINFPDQSKAKEIDAEMMTKRTTILESLFYVNFQFETEAERESFMQRLSEEQNAPEILGVDGQPIQTGAKIIQM